MDDNLLNNTSTKNDNIKTTVIDIFDKNNLFYDPKAKLSNNNIDIFTTLKDINFDKKGIIALL